MYTKFNQGNKINRVVYTIDILFKFNRLTRNYLSCLGQTHSKLYTPFLGKEKNHTLSLLSEREPGNEVTQSSDTSLYRPKKGLLPPPPPDERSTYGGANKVFVPKTILIP